MSNSPLPTVTGNPSTESDIARSYNSFSGSDIRAMIGPYTFAEIQAISYSVTREKAPIYTMGSPDVRSFSRNKRGVAGSLIWINFDRHSLLNLIRASQGTFVANVDDLRPEFRTAQTAYIQDGSLVSAPEVRDTGVPASAYIDQSTLGANIATTGALSGYKELAIPWYSDQILPFDVTASGANEYGAATGMKLYGVEVLNEGSGISIDDPVTEMQATFVARLAMPWMAIRTPWTNSGA
jgi:hypothetical protein